MRREYNSICEVQYIDVAHLKCVGVAKVDTGIYNDVGNNEIKTQFKVQVKYDSISHVIAYSATNSALQVYSNGGRMFNQSAAITGLTSGNVYEFETITTYSQRKIKLLNRSYQVQSLNRSIEDGKQISVLGGWNVERNYPDDMYYLKLYINGTLVRDYVPKQRVIDGVYGWWDNVEGTFNDGRKYGWYYTV